MVSRINEANQVYNAKKTNCSAGAKKNYSKNSIWETKLNGEIEDTKQGNTGDCWLLSNLNSLRDTKWGKKMIKNAIKDDGKGGVIITFKGAKTSTKEFHISAEEIVKARESGIYSEGDDDVIAMELAVEKYLKLYRNQGGQNAGKSIDGDGLDIAEFTELLSGEKVNRYYSMPPRDNTSKEAERTYKERLRILEEIEKHPCEYAVIVSFCGNSSDGVMVGGHAYQLQKVVTENNQKYVILVNPWDSSEKIKMEIKKFIQCTNTLDVTDCPGAKSNNNLKNDTMRKRDFFDSYIGVLEEIQKVKSVKDLKNVDLEKVKNLIELVDENNIQDLFGNKGNISLLINVCDALKSGLGNGKEKKALISPMVDAYCEYAKKQGVSDEIVNEVKSSCYKELDAKLYTNESVIIEKLQMLFDEIEKAKEANNPFKNLGISFENLKFDN